MGQNYEASFYLCFRRRTRGYNGIKARITERLPNLEGGEVAVKVTAKLPAILFQKPLLQATIEVPEGKVSPAVIDAVVADNITQIVQQNLGVDLKLVIEDQRKKK